MGEESIDEVIARVRHYETGPPGTYAYCDGGDALDDAVRLANEIDRLRAELGKRPGRPAGP